MAKKGKDQWVIPRGDRWAVHGAGNQRDTKLFDTQKEAHEYAKKIAKNQKSEVVIQGKDGKIRVKNSFGNDPKNIKDKT